jgi:hypothetical protein
MPTATVSAISVNIRDLPSTEATVVAVLAEGSSVNILADNDDGTWLLVSAVVEGTPRIGWIRADLLATAGSRGRPGAGGQGGEPHELPVGGEGNIDRSRFVAELEANPSLIDKMNEMIRGEVGKDAPLSSHLIMLETVFNRSQMRGHSLERGLLSVRENPRLGYYAADTYGHGGAYSREEFIEKVLNPVMAGSNLSDKGFGPMTGNASGGVAAHQRARGTKGYTIPASGGARESIFAEGPLRPLPRLGNRAVGASPTSKPHTPASTIDHAE